jgi:hypothetical protein
LTAIAGNAEGDCGRDEKTAHQPNQKTRKMTAVFENNTQMGLTQEGPLQKARYRST